MPETPAGISAKATHSALDERDHNNSWIRFPAWIEHSGLPVFLFEKCKSPQAWVVFKKIVELDCALNRDPGTVEISIDTLAGRLGMDAKKTRQALTKLRKGGVLRSFLPDNDEEEALFQVVVPLPTPTSWEEVRRMEPDLFGLSDDAFRYARPVEAAAAENNDDHDSKLREVVSLYLDNVSMKMNAFILDELRLINRRFDLPLVRKVFARARKKEIQTLGWILREIRREQDILDRAAEERRRTGEASDP